MITATRRRRLAGLLVAALVITGCSRGDDDAADTTLAPQPTSTIAPDDPIVTVDGVTVDGGEAPDEPQLGVELSDGESGTETADPIEVAPGEPLTDDEIAAVLEPLPGWSDDPADESDFERPPDTLLPPEVGETVDQPFPPEDDAPTPPDEPSGPLEVLRFQPEGDVDLAPFVTATFSEPMVPVATLEQLDAADVPMTISPTVEGRWRWLGTRTLRFEVVPGELDRLPDATSYEVTIPAGTESANGAVLSETVTWTFETPTVELIDLNGISDSMPTDPVWVAEFNQRIDDDAVLEAVTATAAGEPVELRLADDADLERDDDARHAVTGALPDRAMAFVPAADLPVDSPIVIEIGPNVPSAEGPLTSPTVERFTGRTFGALRVARTSCAWDDECVPGAPFLIEFSNRLDPELFRADMIGVAPDIPGLHIDVYGNTIELRGTTRGQTTYEVTLDGELADVFGQQLGDDTTIEFDVGSARPALNGLQREFITTDPGADQATVSITTINHDAVQVRAWAVTPGQLTEFYEYVDELWRDEEATVPEWPEVLDTEVEIDNVEDTYVETAIDLTEAIGESGGEVIVRVDPVIDIGPDDEEYWANRPTVAWVQQTTLGVDAILDNEKLVIATNDLVTGEPIDGVPVELLGDGRVATTGEGGLVELDLGDEEVIGLFANGGDRTALLPAERWGGWQAQTDAADSRWYVFDDRGIYRPGETAHLTGWVRRFEWSEENRLALYPDDVGLQYRAYDAQGAELADGTVELSAVGGFSIDVELPSGTNLGPVWIEFSVQGDENGAAYQHSFQVQEFRRPDFEVTTRAETPPPYYDTVPTTVAVDASYFSGAPLPDAEVNWLVTTTETSYAPPGWDDYNFGIWQPWWYDGPVAEGGFAVDVAADVAEPAIDCFDCPPFGEVEYEEFTGRTDASGSHFLQIDFDGDEVDLPSTVTAEATVFDVNRQAWASRTDLLVHPAQYYVGLRADRNFVEPGTPIRIDAVVTDVDGEVTAGRPVEMTAGRVEWGYIDGTESEELVDTQSCTFRSTTVTDDESMRCEFDTEVGGTYRITATVTDESGQASRSEITQWVSGGQSRPVRNVQQERVTIVPDREDYEPGDTAELLVQAPFAPAYGTVTIIHHGIVSSEAFDAEDGSAVIEIPIEDAFVPNISVQVDMNGSTVRTDDDGNPRDDLPPRTAYATGTIGLPVPPVTRALDVSVEPAETALEPGDETSVTVRVDDAGGEPVEGADVAVLVVDEAILALTGYELDDPLDVMYADLWSAVRSRYFRSTVLLSSAEELDGAPVPGTATDSADDMAEESAEEPADAAGDLDAGGDGAARSGVDDPILLRSDFDPVAVYAPGEVTGADGTVTVAVPLPDSLTRYRVMAVAVSGAEQFGKGESSITARLPLMVRPSAPRFLNYGDRFDLPVVLQNQTDEPLDVDIAVATSNLNLVNGDGRRVTVPANNRIEVRFPAITAAAGTARVRVAAVSGSFSDATTISLPVYTPATTEAFATYGVIDDAPIVQPLAAPGSVIPDFGGLEIGTSSTALQALTDSVLYLVDYEYQSSDAYASRIMAVASLRDVLEAFAAEGLPAPDELDAQVTSDIARLSALQNEDGGFPYWQRGRESIPWNSIQAAHALVLAEQAGYTVASATLDAALGFIAAIEEHTPSDYSQDVKRTLSAYALYVRAVAGRTDTAKAETLYETAGDELELDALAWIWPSITDPDLRAAIETRFTNSAVDTPGGVTFATDYGEDAYVIAHSDARTDGAILDALITQLPDSDLIPKLVNGLLGRRTQGRWNNDQENSFVLVAMKRYFDTFEATDPAFVARAWIDDAYVAEAPFLDRTTERSNTLVPMSDLVELVTPADGDDGVSGSLTIAKDGDGRLYYRLGLTYAPSDLQLDARDEGFVVERTYVPVDDDEDVTRDANGHWHIRAGASVRVHVTMVADARRTHVALTDPLPAGLEPVNPDLVVSQTIPPDEASDGDGPGTPIPDFWWWNWFEHQNLRDDRAEAFATYLGGGTYEYTYVARATTPGTFVTPPAKAEEIYSPEVFGRSATDVVIVE